MRIELAPQNDKTTLQQGKKRNKQIPIKIFPNKPQLLTGKHPHLTAATLSNIFPTRLIENKTHERPSRNRHRPIHQSIHITTSVPRTSAETHNKAKSKEKDIPIINEMTKIEFPPPTRRLTITNPPSFHGQKLSECFHGWNKKAMPS